ncbi:ParA family protein [Bilifractor sp. LCP19S3_H10]|jgi:chromosome partitioning protein|uniref:Sporulation initiation inhibitor protein Soj n=1 Tax=Bilifractor porci TaxID=2606636 RepID=A0A7X2PA58_9FIRM|nr:ParA family protein [Bilifractor porci]MST82996.1 ParA family protein [Bilifractor porci]
MSRTKIMACINQKGGTGKSTTCENLGIGLANEGKKVLLVDMDPQASLTIALGWQRPDDLETTISDLMIHTVREDPLPYGAGILHHGEGVDLIPANISLAGLEVSLVNVMSRESVLKETLSGIRDSYDYILLDGMPSLGMLTINTLAASDSIVIPVQPQYLSAKGLEQLLQTVHRVKRQINPGLKIDGILLTMTDSRTNYTKEITGLIREQYGRKIRVYDTEIPRSVRAAEISAEGKSIYLHDPKGKVADAYKRLTKEVLNNEARNRQRAAECL